MFTTEIVHTCQSRRLHVIGEDCNRWLGERKREINERQMKKRKKNNGEENGGEITLYVAVEDVHIKWYRIDY